MNVVFRVKRDQFIALWADLRKGSVFRHYHASFFCGFNAQFSGSPAGTAGYLIFDMKCGVGDWEVSPWGVSTMVSQVALGPC